MKTMYVTCVDANAPALPEIRSVSVIRFDDEMVWLKDGKECGCERYAVCRQYHETWEVAKIHLVEDTLDKLWDLGDQQRQAFHRLTAMIRLKEPKS